MSISTSGLSYQSENVEVHPKCLDSLYDETDKEWKDIEEMDRSLGMPAIDHVDTDKLDRIKGSIIGLALGDALGAHAEFRPYEYIQTNPIKDMVGGGTWGLDRGKFTDDTSMALCLAASLISNGDFVPYDQLVRYKWWHKHGYMSSTGECFDIGTATNEALEEFTKRQSQYIQTMKEDPQLIDQSKRARNLEEFNVYCGEQDAAGNGALMRLAPVPLFFYRNLFEAIEFSGRSGTVTHGSQLVYDSCRYYGALIVKAINGASKKELTQSFFYKKHRRWFGEKEFDPQIAQVANGSYKRPNGYQDGIRGKGFVVQSLEAALWAFWSTDDFRAGALAAVNLGDDTDTTAAIYGQLAGAYYGYKNLPSDWLEMLYGKDFLIKLSHWIYAKGELWDKESWKREKIDV